MIKAFNQQGPEVTAVISINGYYRLSVHTKIKNTDIPVFWAYGEKDNILPQKEKDSYHLLLRKGVKQLELIPLTNANHDDLSIQAAVFIASKIKKSL